LLGQRRVVFVRSGTTFGSADKAGPHGIAPAGGQSAETGINRLLAGETAAGSGAGFGAGFKESDSTGEWQR
jgi:hypothetical protein